MERSSEIYTRENRQSAVFLLVLCEFSIIGTAKIEKRNT